ncbi:hypothetical protein [Streptacidiphilus sp. PAMC 29251]
MAAHDPVALAEIDLYGDLIIAAAATPFDRLSAARIDQVLQVRPDGVRPEEVRPDGVRPDGVRPDESEPEEDARVPVQRDGSGTPATTS